MNQQFFFFFYNLAHQSYFFDKLIVFTAEILPYTVVLLAGIFLLFSRRFSRDPDLKASGHHYDRKEIILVFFSGAFAWILAYGLKYLFHLARPFDALPGVTPLFLETGYTFPSGHATFFMALAFSIFFSHKKAGYLFIFFALLIGLARIIAGVHFPIDILGGFILGFIIAFFLKNV